jgi:hypothetical protein
MGLSRLCSPAVLSTSAFGVLLVIACSDGSSGGFPAQGTAAAAGIAGAGGSTSTGGSAGTGGGVPATPGAQFLLDYTAAVCGMYQPCCNADGLGYDFAGCVSWFSRVTDAYLGPDYDAEKGEACLQKLADAAAADPERCGNVALFDEATFWEECSDAFTIVREGVALGEVCDLAGDCASSEEGPVICYGDRCLLQLEGADGDGPCYIQGSENRPLRAYTCDGADGVYCDRASNACKAQAATGEYCPFSNACDPKTAMCVGGTCVALGRDGEACVNGIPGAGGHCAPGFVCDRVALTCGPGPTEGEPCMAGQCETGVCLDGVCKKSDYQKSMNCTG